jgi:hypothetical protein
MLDRYISTRVNKTINLLFIIFLGVLRRSDPEDIQTPCQTPQNSLRRFLRLVGIQPDTEPLKAFTAPVQHVLWYVCPEDRIGRCYSSDLDGGDIIFDQDEGSRVTVIVKNVELFPSPESTKSRFFRIASKISSLEEDDLSTFNKGQNESFFFMLI